jgi:hypothetical protein
VSNPSVAFRFRVVLPLVGLALFGIMTWQSVRWNNQLHPDSRRFFFWASIRLDSDPLDKHSEMLRPCPGDLDCASYPPERIWVEPGWVEPGLVPKILMITGLPAFAVSLGLTRGLGRLGVNEVLTFMLTLPALLLAWYFCLGWLLDRHGRKRIAISS